MYLRRLSLFLLCGCGGAGEAETGPASTSAATDEPTTASASDDASDDATGEPTDGATTDEPDPCAASPQTLADCVEPGAYADDLRFIADIRTPGSPHWQAVQDLCADRLGELGYEVDLQDYGTGVNVVGRRLGRTSPKEVVLVAAHYDHIEDCHGADDNASGVAAVLEIARMLARAEFDRTVTIACWDEEELGLIGSEAYVAAAVAAKDEIVINFNFDMIGVRSDAENSQRVPAGFDAVFPEQTAQLQTEGFRGDFIAIVASTLANEHSSNFATAADRIGLKQTVLELPAGTENSPLFDDLRRSDHASFWLAGFPAVFLTDTGEFRNDHYHCMNGTADEVDDLDLAFAAEVARATVEASAEALGLVP